MSTLIFRYSGEARIAVTQLFLNSLHLLHNCLRWSKSTRRDVVLTKRVWEHTQKSSHFKTASTDFKAKHEKGVGTPFPRVPAPLYNCLHIILFNYIV